MAWFLTTYTDGTGAAYEAVQIRWDDIPGIIGHPHAGDSEDGKRLIEHILATGGPEWVKDAEGFVDEVGWGLIGPKIEEE